MINTFTHGSMNKMTTDPNRAGHADWFTFLRVIAVKWFVWIYVRQKDYSYYETKSRCKSEASKLRETHNAIDNNII